jgi:ferric-dicitrate binding protein FerR (iron transport regulator)
MNREQLQNLIEKFLAGTATPEEKARLNEWYRLENEKTIVWESHTPYEEAQVQQRMLQQLQHHMNAGKVRDRAVAGRRRIISYAAAVTGILLVSGYFMVTRLHNRRAVTAGTTVQAPVAYTENRYLLLPDSSTVLLHPGSSITYSFSATQRQVQLTGEAYFDVKHQSSRPFVIHTGHIVTTVLGTAFNISAYPGKNVIVSVTRGRVSVVDETRQAGNILVPDEQLTYSNTAGTITRQKVEAANAVSWTRADLQFDSMPFGQLADKLNRRYDVVIRFNNPALKNCLITGAFTGTESLEEVLQTIANTLGTTYTINNNTVTIDGKECM